jgi:predicted N-acetyltransferase YhbS
MVQDSMSSSEKPKIIVRPLQYRDLEEVRSLLERAINTIDGSACVRSLQSVERWRNAQDFLRSLPHPQASYLLVAECNRQLCGAIRVVPFNRSRTTWQVAWAALAPIPDSTITPMECGSQLLRYCFEKIVEASNWVLEVDVNDKVSLGLYRQNGFQPLAQLTYWEVPTEALRDLSQHSPDLPNLLPIRNTDAQLLYQLDTVSMPPLLRQVFDRQIHDFKLGFFQQFQQQLAMQLDRGSAESNYVFESQRKAAIGCYKLEVGTEDAHKAQLTVHPAYTWLYPELMSRMAESCQACNSHLPLQLISADYHSEREEYLQKIGAQRTAHGLLMSRSVWHKVRETKQISLEGLQLSDVLSGLQPSRSPIPNRWESTMDPEEPG